MSIRARLWAGIALLLAALPSDGADRSATEAAPSGAKPVTDGVARRALEFATTDDADFAPLPKPGPSDWLASQKEPGQTFSEYVRSNPIRPDAVRKVLVLQPLGRFDKDQKEVLDKAAKFAGIFFQLQVRVEGELALPDAKGSWRVNRFTDKPQYLSTHLMYKVLLPRLPKDAFADLGVTMADLYPAESWNYVFGQASLGDRVGVYSLVRYTPEFWGNARTSESDVMLLRRTCKVLSHETGHMFGLAHCTAYHCGMNGSNNLGESDRQPIFFCPECLKKLQWNIGFDVVKRYAAEREFFAANGMKPEADWLDNRLARIRQAAEAKP